jgi:hypothetical protein
VLWVFSLKCGQRIHSWLQPEAKGQNPETGGIVPANLFRFPVYPNIFPALARREFL